MLNETIIALATPPMEGALALIRVSGEDSFELLKKMFSNTKNLQGNKIHYGKIIDNNIIIDEVLVSVFKKPKSFTGENSFEITCHGGMFIVEKIISLALKHGARLAKKGEFTQRAYLNNKIDLIQAEAINDMIRATTEEESNLAMMSLQGQTSSVISEIKQDIIKLLANIEVNIDYPEYDDAEVVTKQTASDSINKTITKIEQTLREARIGRIIKDGINVAIVGKPNVGKSSILNALLNEDKAIVTNIEGTTRDVVEGQINLDGLKLNLLDTAGIRETEGKIEQIGIKKSKEIINLADLILVVFDGSEKLNQADLKLIEMTKDKDNIKVINKIDLGEKIDIDGVKISAENKNINPLLEEIKERLKYNKKAYKNKPLLTNARHIGLLQKALDSMLKAKEELNKNLPIDLISIEISNSLFYLEELLGAKTKINIYEEIFSQFCLGK